jgi:hypothetical protein
MYGTTVKIVTQALKFTYILTDNAAFNVPVCKKTAVAKHTGRFIMYSGITEIYYRKTVGPTLMELFTATSIAP